MTQRDLDKQVSFKQFIGGGITLLFAIGATFLNSLLTLREIEVRVKSLEHTINSVTKLDGKIEVLLERTQSMEIRQGEISRTNEEIQRNILQIYKER